MRGRSILVAVLLFSGALAGCIGEDGSTEATGDDIQAANATPNGTGTIDTETIEGEVQVSAATPVVSFNFNSPTAEGPFQTSLERPSNATGHVLEVTWDAATPASESMDLWVRQAGEGNIPPSDPADPPPAEPAATATGESPLKLAVADEDLEEDTDYDIIVRAPSDMGAGVAVDQAFTLHISTFQDVDFDPDYSAVGNGTAAR